MEESKVDNFIQYLWTEYQSDTGDWNVLLTSLLDELREKLIEEK